MKSRFLVGHGRVEAAKLLGIDALPTCRLSHLSEAEKRAYMLADNKLAEKAGWDKELLAIELQELIDLDFEVELTGFEIPEIELILEAGEAKGSSSGPDDRVPQYPSVPVVTQASDLWLLGNHRLLCADARDRAGYERLLEGAKAEFVFTGPPYNLAIEHNVSDLGWVRHRDFAMGSGGMKEAEFIAFLETVFGQMVENTVDGSIHQVCMGWRHMWEMLTAGRKVYSELKNLCIWNKSHAGNGSYYRSKHNLIFVWKSGTGTHTNNFHPGQHGRTDVWGYANVHAAGVLQDLAMRPTIKPVALVADAIKDCSRRGAFVLDPFCGCGTTLVAAERTGRKARAMETDPAYVDVAVRRWQDYTGRAAVLAASGESFETVEEQRAAKPAAA